MTHSAGDIETFVNWIILTKRLPAKVAEVTVESDSGLVRISLWREGTSRMPTIALPANLSKAELESRIEAELLNATK